MKIKVGCCGFPVSRERYFREFAVVEIQQSFYHPPELKTARKWRDEAPSGFEYTLKAWQLITHEPKSPTYRRLRINIPPSKERSYGSFRPTDEVCQAWDRTRETADALGSRIVVFQCPASFTPTDEHRNNLKRFFSAIERGRFTFAWEPRGGWTEREIEAICREMDLIHVGDPFKAAPVWGEMRYYRLHGIGGYRYKYTEDDLKRLKGMIEGNRETYVMFNNVSMFDDAVEFRRLLERI